MTKKQEILQLNANYAEKYGFHYPETYIHKTAKGLTAQIVEEISKIKTEPQWMLEKRLKGLEWFFKKPLPSWGADLSSINFSEMTYYLKPTDKVEKSWEDLPDNIKKTFDRLGIPEAERKFLGGVGAQYDSDSVYHKVREDLASRGVVFLGMDEALQLYPDRVKKYFGTVVPAADNKFAALNTATWSGGSFVYVPKGVKVTVPLQAYFRINAANFGQFERTLIIADEGAEVTYVEGCFTKGTMIHAMSEFKPIEEIQVDDNVLTHNGKYKRVYHTQVRPYAGNVYKIFTYGNPNEPVEVTEEHPFLCARRQRENERNNKWKIEWVAAKDLQHFDYLATPRIKVTQIKKFIEVKTTFRKEKIAVKIPSTKEFFRLVGYYLAEGSTDREHYLSFSFGEHEKNYIADVKQLLKKLFGIEKTYESWHKKNHGISIVVSSTKLARIFEQLFGKGSSNKQIPHWMMLEDHEKQKQLILGLFRGDGNYYNKKTKTRGWLKEVFRISTTSQKLAKQTKDVLLRIGIAAFVNARDRKHEGRKTTYTVGITGEYLNLFGKIVGIKIREKLNKKKRATMFYVDANYLYAPIRKVKKKFVKNMPVYNFSVQDDESYVANGAAVHNCSAPIYSTDSLHAAVVEIIALKNSKVRYTTIQNWSSNVYNLVTKRAYAYENAVVEWIDCNIGCLIGDSKVLLNNEVKNIKDVKQNDTVFSMNENFELVRNRVLGKTFTGKKEVFKLRALNHREITATSNHPFLMLRKVGTQNIVGWAPLETLRPGDLVAISGKVPDYGRPYKISFTQKKGNGRREIQIPLETGEKLAWLLGFYIGDGYLDKTRVCFAVPSADKSYERVKNLLVEIFGVKVIPYKQILRASSVSLVQLVKQLGFSGNARTKRVPEWVFTLPEGQKREFINGYIAADGHMRKGHTNISITSCSKELLEQVKTLAISCGLNPLKISKWSRVEKKPLGKEIKEYTSYFLYFGNQEMQSPVQFAPIATISPAGYADTYDIEVEGTHNFVADGFIVHNSKATMKYPSVFLLGERAKADILSVAFAGKGQHQDAGGKVLHFAPNTTSRIISKSVSKDGGRVSYRGLVQIAKGATNSTSSVRCDALLLDEASRSDTYPTMKIDEEDSTISHEAYVGKIGEEQLFYLRSRGFTESEATAMIVLGFIAELTKEFPMEYAIELNKLIELEMEGSVG